MGLTTGARLWCLSLRTERYYQINRADLASDDVFWTQVFGEVAEDLLYSGLFGEFTMVVLLMQPFLQFDPLDQGSGWLVVQFSGVGPEQYYICKSMSLWAIEKQASKETTNISKANNLLTTLSRNIQCLL